MDVDSRIKELSDAVEVLSREKDEYLRKIDEKDSFIKELKEAKFDLTKKHWKLAFEVDKFIEKLKCLFDFTLDQQSVAKAENYTKKFEKVCHDIYHKYYQTKEELDKRLEELAVIDDALRELTESKNKKKRTLQD